MSIAPIILEFLTKGIPQVQHAFKSVQDAAMRADRAQLSSVEKTEKAKTEAVSKWSKVRERIQDRSATMAGRLAAKQAKDEANAVRQVEREKTRAANAETRAKERAAREQERIITQHARAEVRIRREAEREVERIGERGRAAARRQHAREERERDQDAKRWVRTRTREKEQEAAARGRLFTSVVGAGARGVVNGFQRTGNVAMGLANTAAQLGGGFSIADSVTGEQNMRKQAAVLSASTVLSRAGQPGSDPSLGRAVSTDEVLSNAKAVGISQDIDPSEVMRGFDEIKKLTGNLEKATQVMPAVAKLATATGGDLSEMSGLAGNILAAHPTISNDDLESQMRIFARQGVVGGVEVADFAKYGSRITAGASMYGTDPSKGVTKETNEATLGAMAQMARQYGSASGASEATLGSLRFSTDLAKHADTLRANGINVSDGKGNLKDAQSVLLEMLDVTKGDVTKLASLGLGDRGVRPLEGVANIYKNAGGGDKGKEAVKAEFAKYTTGVSKEEIDAANKRVLSEQKVEQAMRELRIAAGEQLLPAFKEMLPVLKELIPAFVDAAKVAIFAFTEFMKSVSGFAKTFDWLIADMAAHPIATLFLAEIAKASLPTVLPALFRAALAGVGGVPLPTPPAGTLPAAAGLGLTAAPLAASALVVGSALKGARGYTAGVDRGELLAEKVRAWGKGDREYGVSPEVAAAEISSARKQVDGYGSATRLGDWVTSPVSDASSQRYDKMNAARGLIDSRALQSAISQAAAAGVREGVSEALRGGNSGAFGAGRGETIRDRTAIGSR